jgi:hypothetical protein
MQLEAQATGARISKSHDIGPPSAGLGQAALGLLVGVGCGVANTGCRTIAACSSHRHLGLEVASNCLSPSRRRWRSDQPSPAQPPAAAQLDSLGEQVKRRSSQISCQSLRTGGACPNLVDFTSGSVHAGKRSSGPPFLVPILDIDE